MEFSPKVLAAKAKIEALLKDTPWKAPAVETVAVILGSGLGGVTAAAADFLIIPYSEIPFFPLTTVTGHEGSMIWGRVGERSAVFLSGRLHAYEGYNLSQVTFPVEVLAALGVKDIILTAAAGGLQERFSPGDIMIVSDHLNLMGDNPLRGRPLPGAFVDLSEVYHSAWRSTAQKLAADMGIKAAPGVLAALLGPSYETPAEVRMLQLLGADAVCMSTVPEAVTAKYLGMKVLALALITNSALKNHQEGVSHHQVLAQAREFGKNMERLIIELIKSNKDR